MLKAEFESLIGSTVSESAYDLIEYVYNWHPEIRDKQHCADLYKIGGLWIFKDMEARAQDAEELDDLRREIQDKIREMQEDFQKAKDHHRDRWEVRQ